MTTIVDFATAADLPAMADLLHELFTLESDFQPERDKQLRGLQMILDTPALGQLFVLRVDGKVVGLSNRCSTGRRHRAWAASRCWRMNTTPLPSPSTRSSASKSRRWQDGTSATLSPL